MMEFGGEAIPGLGGGQKLLRHILRCGYMPDVERAELLV